MTQNTQIISQFQFSTAQTGCIATATTDPEPTVSILVVRQRNEICRRRYLDRWFKISPEHQQHLQEELERLKVEAYRNQAYRLHPRYYYINMQYVWGQ